MAFSPGADLTPPEVKNPHELELFLRMVFSALVDADFLDTENHMKPEMGTQRGNAQTIERLWQKLQAAQAAISGIKHDTLNSARHEIYAGVCAIRRFATGFLPAHGPNRWRQDALGHGVRA